MSEDKCTIENPCGLYEGDCDSDAACLEDLACGVNNCPQYLGLNSEIDCCYTLKQITQIKSPNYPSPYPSNIKETWLLMAYPMGSTINLQFHSFNVR